MTKTLEEWFDALPSNDKLYLSDLTGFIKTYDSNGKETHYTSNIVTYKIEFDCLKEHNSENSLSNYQTARKTWHANTATNLLFASRLKQLNAITDAEYHDVFKDASDTFSETEITKFITPVDLKHFFKIRIKSSNESKLIYCIFVAEDPEHPDWSLLVSEKETNNRFDWHWFKFIPFEEALKLVRKDTSVIRHLIKYIQDIADDEIRQNYLKQTREFLFCENGLTPDDRNDALISAYQNRTIHSFIQEILPIDFRYGKLLQQLYKAKGYNDRAIVEEMNSIINLRKCELSTPEEKEREDWYNSTEANQYRYSKKIRQMAMLFRACITKSYPKTKIPLIGDALYLLKLYDFKWSDVFSAVYGHSDI